MTSSAPIHYLSPVQSLRIAFVGGPGFSNRVVWLTEILGDMYVPGELCVYKVNCFVKGREYHLTLIDIPPEDNLDTIDMSVYQNLDGVVSFGADPRQIPEARKTILRGDANFTLNSLIKDLCRP